MLPIGTGQVHSGTPQKNGYARPGRRRRRQSGRLRLAHRVDHLDRRPAELGQQRRRRLDRPVRHQPDAGRQPDAGNPRADRRSAAAVAPLARSASDDRSAVHHARRRLSSRRSASTSTSTSRRTCHQRQRRRVAHGSPVLTVAGRRLESPTARPPPASLPRRTGDRQFRQNGIAQRQRFRPSPA